MNTDEPPVITDFDDDADIEELVERDHEEAKRRLLECDFPHRFSAEEWADYVEYEMLDRELDAVAKDMDDEDWLFAYISYVEGCELGFEDDDEQAEVELGADSYPKKKLMPAQIRSTFGYSLPNSIDPELWAGFLMSRHDSLPPLERQLIFEYLEADGHPDDLLQQAIDNEHAYPLRWPSDDYWDFHFKLRDAQRAAGRRLPDSGPDIPIWRT